MNDVVWHEEAGDRIPETLEDLLRDYDQEDIRSRLSSWLSDPPEGKEFL
jgi:hypothetical protein